jgi:hypothetical protein
LEGQAVTEETQGQDAPVEAVAEEKAKVETKPVEAGLIAEKEDE